MPERASLVQHYTGNWFLVPADKREEWHDAWAHHTEEPVWAATLDLAPRDLDSTRRR